MAALYKKQVESPLRGETGRDGEDLGKPVNEVPVPGHQAQPGVG